VTAEWYGDESRLTPDQLQAVEFSVSRLGRRGYEEEPVQRLLRVVHAEFVRLVNERASLWQDVQRLRRRILAGEAADDDDRGLLRRGRRACPRGADPVHRADHRRPVRRRRPGLQQPGHRGSPAPPRRHHAGGAAALGHALGRSSRQGPRRCGSALNVAAPRGATASAAPPRPNSRTSAPTATSTAPTSAVSQGPDRSGPSMTRSYPG
jgi:hypothetical protein